MCLSNLKDPCKENVKRFLFLRSVANCSPENPSGFMDEDIDTTNESFINEIWLVVDDSEIIIKTFAFLPVVLWGIFGNMALIYVIWRHRHLRSPTNLLVGNMAVAYLFSLLIHPWVFLVNDFFQNYQLGVIGCKTEGAVECAVLLTGVMSLAAISYDRLTAIVLPKETRLTRNGAKIVMAVTWFAGVVLASPLFFYRTYKERKWLDFTEKYCTEDTIVVNIYWHVIITMLVWLPLSVMSICYISIFVKLDRYEKKLLQHSKLVVHIKYKAKVAKTMFIVVIVFIICHLPFTALIFYRNYLLNNHKISNNSNVINAVNGTYSTLWFTSKYLIILNAALNPVIYGMMNEKFCRVFKVMPVIRWFFNSEPVKVKCEERRKPTKETVIESNKNKLFTIFKAKSPKMKLNNTTVSDKVVNI